MSDSPRIIKKYPNRRLYDTANSGYITLADVKQMVLEDLTFQVIDAKSGDDLTRTILLQIILEEEAGGMPMFSSEMLAQMIRFYGSAQQTVMGQYIEQNVKAFLAIQKKLQDQAKQIYGDKMMITPDLWKQFMQMQAPPCRDARQLSRAEREALHGHAAANAGPDARHLRRVPVPQFGAPQQTPPDDSSKR
jgi:polyhydroxyalkanoate synthesis repressor PhaR